MRPEPVGIGNQAFLIANAVKTCPAITVIRELLQNAIEASGTTWVQWFAFDWNGIRKLGLYNEGEGAGMTEQQLRERAKIASSGKELGFDKNFGQGAKLSAGKASPYGLVYRSCAMADDGRHYVHEMWLQMQDRPNGGKELVIVPQYDMYQNEHAVVRQVTDDALRRGRYLDREWTEAILLGRSSIDETTSGAFLGESSVLWLMGTINQRYYEFPSDVIVRDATIPSSRERNHRNARGMWAVLRGERTERHEEIAVVHPQLGVIEIVYGKLSGTPQSRKGGPLGADGLPGGTHICLVWRDEIYDFDSRWYYRAGAYGFSGASEDYYVHLRLSDDAPVINNSYRTEILFDERDSERLACVTLCDLVRDNRPQWVIEDITSRNETDNYEQVETRLRRLAMKFKAEMDMPVVSGEGNDSGLVETDAGDGQSGSGAASHNTPREGGRSARPGIGRRQPRPRAETIRAAFRNKESSPGWYTDLNGKAGSYDKAENTIWLSTDFRRWQWLKEWIDKEWPSSDENGFADRVLRDEYCCYAGAYGIGALSFRQDDQWSPDEWEKCLTQEAISAIMNDAAGAVAARVAFVVGCRFNSGTRRRARSVKDMYA